MQFMKIFLLALLCVFFLDMVWLGLIAKHIYHDSIGMLLRKSGDQLSPNWPAAAIVYIAIITGILFFVLPKANGDYLFAFLWGSLFGAVMYGVYDFTNFSILANWPLKITLIDFVWGNILCGSTALVTLFIQKWFAA